MTSIIHNQGCYYLVVINRRFLIRALYLLRKLYEEQSETYGKHLHQFSLQEVLNRTVYFFWKLKVIMLVMWSRDAAG